jgi:hypothetical protein
MLAIWRLFVAVMFVAAPVSLSLADGSSLPYSEGGYVPDFVKIVRQYSASGEQFRIEATCKSACTLFLGIRNVCIERDAKLMFHAGHDISENRTGLDTRASSAALYRYNESLRRYLVEGHHMDTDAFHTLTGAELVDRFGYRERATK